MKIRNKILLILLFSIIPIFFVATAIYIYNMETIIKNDATKNLETIANLQKQRLLNYIEFNKEKLRLLNSKTQLKTTLNQYYKTKNKQHLDEINSLLKESLTYTKTIENIFIVDLSGDVVASVDEKDKNQNFKSHPLFKKAQKDYHETYLIHEDLNNRVDMMFTSPLEFEGQIMGILAMKVKSERLKDVLISRNGLGETGEVLMGLQYRQNNILLFTPLRFQSSPLMILNTSQMALPMLNAIQGKEITFENSVDYRGENVVAVTRYIDELKVGIVVKKDLKETYLQIEEIKSTLIKLFAFLVVLLFFIVFVVTNMITTPIASIIQITKKIANGDYSERIKNYGKDELGQLAIAVNTMTDELVRINDKLALEFEKTSNILSQYVLYSKTDKKGIITDTSDAFCQLSGYSMEELIGSSHNIIRHPDMASELFEDLWKTITHGKTWQGEIKNKTKKGGYYWVHATVSPEYDEDNILIGYVSIRIDITAKKDFEQQQIQLFEQSKMASMGEMIGNIAHQWRQPLSAISISASTMDYESEAGLLTKEKITKYTNDIVHYTGYLSQTIETFKNFLRGDKEKQTVVIQEVIKEAKFIIESGLVNNHIEYIETIDVQNDIVKTMVKDELEQVLINIINNAKDVLMNLDKNEDRWIKLTLTQEDNTVFITIEDNGGGISENVLPHIFEPYFTTKHKSQGTGLGLHMSYKIIVEGLGGKLYAQNTESGAKFFIEIPL